MSKTRSFIYVFSTLTLVGALMFTGCKKKKAFKEEDGQTSADAKLAQGESDAVNGDVNNTFTQAPYKVLSGKTTASAGAAGVLGYICGLNVDTTNMRSSGKLVLNYDGTVCNNRKREGTIVVTLMNYTVNTNYSWKTPGAVLKVDYVNYRMTRASDGKFIELNGTQNLTNVSGGNWLTLVLGQPNLVTTVTGTDLKASFEDGKTATYNINRKFTYTYSASPWGFTCVGEGIGAHNGINNLENYGTTRDGDDFTSEVTTPIIWNTTCGAYAPTQGGMNIKVDGKDFDLKVTFAVDNGGNPIGVAPNTCAYGFKVEWTYKKKTNKKIYGYL